MLTSCSIAFANFDAESTLSGGRAHDFCSDDLLDQLCLTQPLQPCRSQNDGIVFALFKLAQARVDIAAQRMNIEIGTNRFQLRLPPKTSRCRRGRRVATPESSRT